jgi:hypothetical protein
MPQTCGAHISLKYAGSSFSSFTPLPGGELRRIIDMCHKIKVRGATELGSGLGRSQVEGTSSGISVVS